MAAPFLVSASIGGVTDSATQASIGGVTDSACGLTRCLGVHQWGHRYCNLTLGACHMYAAPIVVSLLIIPDFQPSPPKPSPPQALAAPRPRRPSPRRAKPSLPQGPKPSPPQALAAPSPCRPKPSPALGDQLPINVHSKNTSAVLNNLGFYVLSKIHKSRPLQDPQILERTYREGGWAAWPRAQHRPGAQKQKAMRSPFPMSDAPPLVQPCGEIKRLHELFLAKRTALLEAEIAQSAGGSGDREANYRTVQNFSPCDIA